MTSQACSEHSPLQGRCRRQRGENNKKMKNLLQNYRTLICIVCISIASCNTISAQQKTEVKPEILQIKLDVGDPDLYLLRPQSSSSPALILKNNSPEQLSGEFRIELESFDGAILEFKQQVTIEAAHEFRISIPREKLGEFGIKWLHTHFVSEKSTMEVKKELAFAYMNPVGNAHAQNQEMPIAIAYGAGSDNTSPIAAEACRRVGIGMRRSAIWWQAENPDWDKLFHNIRVHREKGIEPYLLVTKSAPYAQIPVDGKKSSASPPVPEEWRKWIRNLATEVHDEIPKGQQLNWEIWNEPDLGFYSGNTDQYLEMMDIAHEEILKVDPESYKVMTGGFASLLHHGHKKDMIKRVVLEGRDNWELFAFHEHGVFPKFIKGLEEELQPILDQSEKPVPVFLTETGMDTRFGQHHQAKELVKKITYSWGRGFKAYTWFNLHDMVRGTHARQPGFTYGLYTRLARAENESGKEYWNYAETYPKASYVALNTFNTVLKGMKFHTRFEMPENEYVYAFSNAEKQVIVAWNQNEAGASVLYQLETDASSAVAIDIMGNENSVPVKNGKVVLNVSPTPYFLVLKGGKKQVAELKLLAENITGKLKPEVVLYNQGTEEQTMDYKWIPALGMEPETTAQTSGKVTLSPGGSVTLSTAMKVGKGNNEIALGSIHTHQLKVKTNDAPAYKMEVPQKVNAIRLTDEFTDWESFALNQQEQVINLFEHDPHTVHLMWQGWKDKYAKAWLANSSGNIKLKLDIRDDEHVLNEKDIASGDCALVSLYIAGQNEAWKWAISHTVNNPVVELLNRPNAQLPDYKPEVKVSPGADVSYEVSIDEKAVGIKNRENEEISFNISVSDNDGEPQGLESYIHLSPDTETPTSWPKLILAD